MKATPNDNKKMSKYLSRKLKFISVLAMCAVVFIHAYNCADLFLTPTTRISEGFKFTPMFEYFFSNGLFRFAVPLFFMISGFLYFFNYENTGKCYLNKLKKRTFSLLVPYLVWCLLSGVLMTVLSKIEFFKGLAIVQEKAFDLPYFFMYFLSPAAFPLWYVQQLIIFVLIAPALYFLISKSRAIILIPIGVLWFCDISFIINSQALFYFCAGAAIAIFGKSRNVTKRDDPMVTLFMTITWVCISFSNTLIAASGDDSAFTTMIMLVLYKLNEVVGLIAAWMIFDHIAKLITDKKGFLLAAAHVFFIYAMHEPLLHIAFQIGLVQNASPLSHLILYIFLPFTIMAACILVSMIIRKLIKPVHKVMTGGRN